MHYQLARSIQILIRGVVTFRKAQESMQSRFEYSRVAHFFAKKRCQDLPDFKYLVLFMVRVVRKEFVYITGGILSWGKLIYTNS